MGTRPFAHDVRWVTARECEQRPGCGLANLHGDQTGGAVQSPSRVISEQSCCIERQRVVLEPRIVGEGVRSRVERIARFLFELRRHGAVARYILRQSAQRDAACPLVISKDAPIPVRLTKRSLDYLDEPLSRADGVKAAGDKGS